MSNLIVDVCKIKELRPHNNADKLEVALVKGWECIVGKGEHRAGELVVFIPPDAVLTQELSDHLGVTGYLSKGRVKTIKLRGVIYL